MLYFSNRPICAALDTQHLWLLCILGREHLLLSSRKSIQLAISAGDCLFYQFVYRARLCPDLPLPMGLDAEATATGQMVCFWSYGYPGWNGDTQLGCPRANLAGVAAARAAACRVQFGQRTHLYRCSDAADAYDQPRHFAVSFVGH